MGIDPHLRLKSGRSIYADLDDEPPSAGSFAWTDFVIGLWHFWRPSNLFSRIRLHRLGLGVLASAVSFYGSDPPFSRWVAPQTLAAAARKALELLSRDDRRMRRLLTLYRQGYGVDASSIDEGVQEGTVPADWLKQSMSGDLEQLIAVADWAEAHGEDAIKIDFS